MHIPLTMIKRTLFLGRRNRVSRNFQEVCFCFSAFSLRSAAIKLVSIKHSRVIVDWNSEIFLPISFKLL
jgi:hypothetical protein